MYLFSPYSTPRGHYPLSPFVTHISPQPALIDPFPSFEQHGVSLVNDDVDEEEFLLRAALERKRQQRAARRQYHQRQLEQQRLFELQQRQLEQQRYKNLLRQERARQLAIAQEQAQARTQAIYEAEQEAIRRYKREQWIKKQQSKQVAVFETFLLQPAHQEPESAYARTIAEAKKQERKLQTQATLEKEEEDEREDESNGLDPLSTLLEALFFPQQKRSQPQEETYPCKRRQQCSLLQRSKEKEHNHEQKKEQEHEQKKQQDHEQKKEQKQAEQAVKSKSQPESVSKSKSKEEQESKKQEQTPAASPYDDLYTALPSILEFVEAVFGQSGSSQNCSSSNNHKSESSGGLKNKDAAAAAKASEATAPTSSSCQLSPELKAADILRQRQQRQNQQKLTLQQKHSELNLIESALDSFSRDLFEAIEGIATEENKKAILNVEEGVSKTMLQIDSVESEGDLTVRQRRKELIRKSQDMLDKVDEFKSRETNTGKKVVRSNDKTESSAQSKSTQFSGGENENEVEPADVVDPLPETEPVADDVQGKSTEAEADNGEEEAIEPYTVAVSAPSPSESETIQDDQEKDAQEEKKEDKTAKAASSAAAAVEQPQDDYDIVPEF